MNRGLGLFPQHRSMERNSAAASHALFEKFIVVECAPARPRVSPLG